MKKGNETEKKQNKKSEKQRGVSLFLVESNSQTISQFLRTKSCNVVLALDMKFRLLFPRDAVCLLDSWRQLLKLSDS